MLTETFITVKKGWFKTKIGLNYDIYAWFLLNDKYRLDINNTDVKDPEKFIVDITHCAAISYCKEHRKKIGFNRENVEVWLNKLGRGDFKELSASIEKSSATVQKKYGKPDKSNEKKK